jgi:hypothetical protein
VTELALKTVLQIVVLASGALYEQGDFRNPSMQTIWYTGDAGGNYSSSRIALARRSSNIAQNAEEGVRGSQQRPLTE